MKKALLMLMAAGGLMFAGCSTARHATRWEYRHATNLAEVNRLAEEGWTVVSFAMPDSGAWQYLLKRAKQ